MPCVNIMANQRRTYRVAEKLRGLVSQEILHAADPRFFLVTVTSVVVNTDLTEAKVYWTVSGEKSRIAEVEDAFKHAAGMFRSQIGRALGTRTVPRLRFYYDNTLDTVDEVNALLANVADSRETGSE